MDVCVVSKDKKAKCGAVKTKKQVRLKYRVQENAKKQRKKRKSWQKQDILSSPKPP
jgi:hypothetical protein